MTTLELMNFLEKIAKKYRKEALESIVRNKHMNELLPEDIKKLAKHTELAQRAIDAVLADYLNVVAVRLGRDWGLYVKHLKMDGKNKPLE